MEFLTRVNITIKNIKLAVNLLCVTVFNVVQIFTVRILGKPGYGLLLGVLMSISGFKFTNYEYHIPPMKILGNTTVVICLGVKVAKRLQLILTNSVIKLLVRKYVPVYATVYFY